MIGRLPTGTKGFDCDFVISRAMAKAFYAARYRFVVRYVGRVQQKPNDFTSTECATLMRAGISVMLCQHVKSAESWDPDGAKLGSIYGWNAATFADHAGYDFGAMLWCDLEGVALDTAPSTVIAYANAWYDAVHDAGYKPGLYVGWRCGLSARDLYYKLKFKAYWSAYNLNRDEYPAVRGVQMRQHTAGPADAVPGVVGKSEHGEIKLNAIDVDLIGKDKMGDSPILMLAPRDR